MNRSFPGTSGVRLPAQATPVEPPAVADHVFQRAMTDSPVPMTLTGLDGTFLEVNAALCTLLGYDAATLCSLTWQQLTHPHDLAADLELFQQVVAGAIDSYSIMKRFLRSDGEAVTTELHVSGIRDNDGALYMFVAQLVDMTEQQRSRQALEDSEERYRLLAESTSDVVTLATADGEVLWASPSWATVLQRDPEAVVGSCQNIVHPGDEAELVRIIAGAVAEQQPRVRTRVRVLRADGSFIWTDNEINLVYQPDGSIAFTHTSMRDVSEQVAAEQRLAAGEERYRLLADYSADAILTVGNDRLIHWASPAAADVLGWSPEELVEQDLFELVHSDDRALHRQTVRKFMTTGADGPPLEVRLRRKDGTWAWVEALSRLVPRSPGRRTTRVVRLRCIDAQIAARDELAASEERYRLLAEHSLDVVMRVGPEGAIEWVSPSARSSLGAEPAELVGGRTEDLVHPDDCYRFKRATASWRATGGAGRINARFRVGPDEYRWFEEVSAPITGPDGSTSGRAVRLRDIEAEHRALESLAESEEIFRRAMADSGAGMALIGPDDHYIEVNQALCDFLGYDAVTLRTKTWRELTHPDDLASHTELAKALERGNIDRYRVVKRYLRPDGSAVVGDVTVTAIRDSQGRFLRFVSQIVDVTEQQRMTHELARSEEHFRLLAENTTDIVARAELDGVINWVSQSITRDLGYQPDEVTGAQIDDFVHPDDLATVKAAKPELQQGEPTRFEARMRHTDGRFLWHSVTVSPALGDDGESVGLVASARNIDREVAARQLVATREAEFRLLAENASDLVIRTDGDGRIEWASPSAEQVLGYRADELIGMMPDKLLPPAEVKRFVRSLATLHTTAPNRRNVRLRRANGTYGWFSALATNLDDAEGKRLRYVIGLRDIDAEMQALAALRASEERFRAAMASAPGGMAVSGLDRRFVEVNEALAELLGRRRRWLVDHGLDDVVHPEDLEDVLSLRRQVGHGQVDSGVQECRLLRADGAVVWVQHATAMLRGSDGSSTAFISQFVDITGEKQAREDLEFLARHDPLTRLANRRVLVDAMEQLLAHRPRGGLQPGLLFVDLDGLKPVNDVHGHTAGDDLIVETARRIQAAVRGEDLVARIGGDEFVVLLPAVRSIDDVVAVGDKIRESIARPVALSDQTVFVSASAGATLAGPGERPEMVLRRADEALYAAKEAGRNRTIAA